MIKRKLTIIFVLCFCILLALTSCKTKEVASSDYSSENQSIDSGEIVNNNVSITLSGNTGTSDETVLKTYYDALKSIDRKHDKKLASVNGEIIYDSDVLEGKAMLEMQINSDLAMRKDLNSSERQDYINKYSKTKEQGLEILVRDKVLLQNALKSGITVEENEVYKQAKYEVDAFKQGDQKLFSITLEGYNISEDEYLNEYYVPNVRNRFLRSEFKKSLNKSSEEFEKQLDELVKQADIKYFS